MIDGTFVMDGLLNSKHEPMPGLHELKKAFAPIGLAIEGGSMTIENRYDFIDLGHLCATYKLEEFSERYDSSSRSVWVNH